MALLMTTSLWDSIDWLNNCPPSWKDDAYKNLLNQLNRIWAPTKAIERGISFEKQICFGKNPLEDVAPDLHEKFNKAYNMIHMNEGTTAAEIAVSKKARFQSVCKKFIMYDEKEFIIYGKQDVHLPPMPHPTAITEDGMAVMLPERIIDIKTTGNYKGQSSYLAKWQHKVYTLLDRVPDFTYIVYEFENKSGLLKDVHIFDYHVDDFEAIDKEVMAKVASVVNFLRSDAKLKKAYLNKFNTYNK